jgi:hypothetical protein
MYSSWRYYFRRVSGMPDKQAALAIPSEMSEAEEHAAAKDLWEKLGFRLIDDRDFVFDGDGQRVAATDAYWCVLNGHDDERLDQPIRHGDWPQEAEIVIRQLWHRCIACSVEKATKAKSEINARLRFSLISSGLMIGSLAIPFLLGALHVTDRSQVTLLWYYGSYLAAVALGALIAGWWARF